MSWKSKKCRSLYCFCENQYWQLRKVAFWDSDSDLHHAMGRSSFAWGVDGWKIKCRGEVEHLTGNGMGYAMTSKRLLSRDIGRGSSSGACLPKVSAGINTALPHHRSIPRHTFWPLSQSSKNPARVSCLPTASYHHQAESHSPLASPCP
jgi:hypothetical protein